jgi:type I restriction enzyme R subunit
MHNVFGSDAKIVRYEARTAATRPRTPASTSPPTSRSASTSRTTPSFLFRHYPENHFSHIIIDECHRSAWGKWSEVLTRNPDAFQIGLTATPRELKARRMTKARSPPTTSGISASAVYDYSLAQGIEDGYLAPCEIQAGPCQHRRQRPCSRRKSSAHKAKRVDTGRKAPAERVRDSTTRSSITRPNCKSPSAWPPCATTCSRSTCSETGAARNRRPSSSAPATAHADDVASHLNNRYADWCKPEGRARADPYAFKCTSMSSGNTMVADLRGTLSSWFVATTVDLLSTGVDVPCVRNIVFFRYLESAIVFHQMVGRGTRIDEPAAS